MASSPEIPSHRACAACRGQKVRCIPDETNPDVCQRCSRAGRPCVFTRLQKRKQRKRTDTRVAELEREMRAMRSALKEKNVAARASSPNSQATGSADSQRGRPPGLWYKENIPDAPRLGQAANWEPAEDDTSLKSIQRHGPQLWPNKIANKPPQPDAKDVIDSGMISMATARQLFEAYRRDLFPHYPMVAIPTSTSAEEMRQTKPALFLAIIAAAAGKEDSDLSAALDKEILQAYATRSLVQSEKSLELVQALLISAVWYHPPSKFGQLKYYEYIHMAATMAMDIGIGSRPATYRSRAPRRPSTIHPAEDVNNPDLSMTPRSQNSCPNTGSIESRRTFLACYIICAGVSLSLRRPNMLRVSSYIRDCVDYIDQSSNALPTDSTLVAWVRLLIIAEEINISLSYDDPGSIASLAELRTQLMLRDFEKRLSAWYNSVPDADTGTGSLLIMYYTIRIYLFEIALHVDHAAEDFRAPYQMGGIHPIQNADDIPTQVLAESIAEAITSSHSLLNTFLAMEVEAARALPVFSYVRISFAAFVLAKLCLSSAHRRSRIGRVLDRSSLKVESYMDRAILHVRNIVGPKKSRVPSIFLALLFKLRQWCLNPEIIEQSEHATSQAAIAQPGHRDDQDDVARDRHPAVIVLEGPRVVEQISSNESSPQTVGGGEIQSPPRNNSTATTTPAVGQDGVPPNSQMDNNSQMLGYNSSTSGGIMNAMPVAPAQSFANAITSTQQSNAYVSAADPMNIDNDMFQFLDDVNAFSEGGLTGLDDWANMPADLMGMGVDMSGWQMPTGNAGAAGGSMGM